MAGHGQVGSQAVKSTLGVLLSVLFLGQVMQVTARQREEAWRRADVFVQRIAFFIGGHHMLALDVGEAGFQLLKGRADQFAEQLFGVVFGVHFGQR